MARSLAQGNGWVNDPGEKDPGEKPREWTMENEIEVNKMADSCWLFV